MQKGYPVVVILKNDRQKYYRALEKADKGNIQDIEKFIAQIDFGAKTTNTPLPSRVNTSP